MKKIESLRIAVLLTCYNRKNITVACLERLSKICENSKSRVEAFLTEDGCTDGTEEAVTALNLSFPLHIQHGDGSLYWAGGTEMAWCAAINQGGFDGYLWLNDDTTLYDKIFDELVYTHNYAMEKYGKGGVYVGSTCSRDKKEFTYGGKIWKNKLLATSKWIQPTNSIQSIEYANGNITYFSCNVVEKIGTIPNGYVHNMADSDCTYTAFKHGFPVLLMRGYCGECDNDHVNEGIERLGQLPLKERIKYHYSPRGLGFSDTQLFQRRHFWYRYPITFLFGWLKIFFPNFYVKLHQLRKTQSI